MTDRPQRDCDPQDGVCAHQPLQSVSRSPLSTLHLSRGLPRRLLRLPCRRSTCVHRKLTIGQASQHHQGVAIGKSSQHWPLFSGTGGLLLLPLQGLLPAAEVVLQRCRPARASVSTRPSTWRGLSSARTPITPKPAPTSHTDGQPGQHEGRRLSRRPARRRLHGALAACTARAGRRRGLSDATTGRSARNS